MEVRSDSPDRSTKEMLRAESVRAVIDILGADRVLFAADYPHEDKRACVKDFDAIRLSDEDRLKLYELNSRRVFGLDGPIG